MLIYFFKNSPGRPRKTPGQKRGKYGPRKTHDKEKLVEDISVACSHCTKDPDLLPDWEQNKYDRIMSRHLWQKHKIKGTSFILFLFKIQYNIKIIRLTTFQKIL